MKFCDSFTTKQKNTAELNKSQSNYDYVDEAYELRCSICKEIFESPKETPCRHRYCQKCIETWLEKQNTCPYCRQALSKQQLVSSSVEHLVEELQVYCTKKNHKDCKNRKGCDWKGRRADLSIHLENDCTHNFCENSTKGCVWEGSKKQLLGHLKNECGFVVISCPKKCGLSVAKFLVEEHIKNTCSIARKEIEDRIERERKLKEKIPKLCDLLNPNANDMICIKINDRYFKTSKKVLTKFPRSLFGILFSETQRKLQKDSDGNVVLDTDEKIFAIILNWLRR